MSLSLLRRPGQIAAVLPTGLKSFMLVGTVWLVSRAGMAVVAGVEMARQEASLTDVVSQWDVWHFLAIANKGYADWENVAFFPGLPLLLAGAGKLGLPPVAAGMAAALVASGLAAWALVRLANSAVACLWLIAPTAVFTAVPYSEALFCAAAFWAWWHATQDRWGVAAALAGLACTTRVSGLFLIGALGLLAISQVWRTSGWGKGLARRWAWLPPSGH